jgi:hypothetical protein
MLAFQKFDHYACRSDQVPIGGAKPAKVAKAAWPNEQYQSKKQAGGKVLATLAGLAAPGLWSRPGGSTSRHCSRWPPRQRRANWSPTWRGSSLPAPVGLSVHRWALAGALGSRARPGTTKARSFATFRRGRYGSQHIASPSLPRVGGGAFSSQVSERLASGVGSGCVFKPSLL